MSAMMNPGKLKGLTISLYPYIHERLRRVRYRIPTELHIRAVHQSVSTSQSFMSKGITYFFMIMYLRAFPNVWSSPSIWNDAALSVAPGS